MRRRAFLCLAAAARGAQDFAGVRPSPQQLAWHELEVGASIYFGMSTFAGAGTAGSLDPKSFHPSALDVNQWVSAARSAGATQIILTAKHQDGFCLWPSAGTSFSVKSSPWAYGKGDLVRDAAGAVRRAGLKFGIALSLVDRNAASYKDPKAYDAFFLRQLTELATGYGELNEFWLDPAEPFREYDVDRYVDTLRAYQPNALIYVATVLLKHGDIRRATPAPQDVNWNVIERNGHPRYGPAQTEVMLRAGGPFWRRNSERSLRPLDGRDSLLDAYHNTVGRGAQLVLGISPDDRGVMPVTDVERLEEFGKAIRSLYAKRIEDTCPDPAVVCLAEPAEFSRFGAMEELDEGQRVQRFVIEVRDGGGSWREVHSGATIGHKRIGLLAKPQRAREVRLRVTQSLGPPRIKSFQIFSS